MLKMKNKLTVIHFYTLAVLKFILVFFTLNILPASAQKSPNELSIYCGSGLASYLLRDASIGYSFDAGIGFTGFFSPRWGIHIGAGMGFYNVKASAYNLQSFKPEMKDCAGNLYDLYSTLNSYHETQNPIFVTFPVMLQFQTKQNHFHIF